MLTLDFGFKEGVEYLYVPSDYFDVTFENEWISNPLSREMIKDIDKSTIIDGRVIDSPYLGTMSPMELSGGVKALILMMYEPQLNYMGNSFGDNCAPWILK